MSLTPAVAKLYPVVLALANTGLGVGLYTWDAFLFAALMWTSGALVVAGLLSSVAPGLIPGLEDTRGVSRRQPR